MQVKPVTATETQRTCLRSAARLLCWTKNRPATLELARS